MSIPIAPQKYIWLDGKLTRWDEAKIHIISHALHYGTGVFEGMRAYKTERGTAIFRFKEHIRRLFDSAKFLKIQIGFSESELLEACRSVLSENSLDEAYIRPIAFKDCMAMGLNASKCASKVVIAAWPWSTYLGDAYTKGARCMISSWRRMPSFSFPTVAKICGSYVNSQFAKMEAVEHGYDEAIMLDVRGYVSEGSGENVFVVRGDRLATPPLSASVLPGITRDTVMTLARSAGYDVREEDITVGELLTSDEVFLTGTAAEVTPVVEVNGHRIGNGKPGRVTTEMQRAYERVTRGKEGAYLQWLEILNR
jgi:branched-chain amino acid aminotransferase